MGSCARGPHDARRGGTPTATDGLLDNSLVLVALHLWKLHIASG